MLDKSKEQHIFIIGSKGIPAQYGGFESFVENLTYHKKSETIKYHVSCIANESDEKNETVFTHNGAECFKIQVPKIGAAKAILYDIKSLRYAIAYIKREKISNPVIYVLACRIGPVIAHYKRQIKALGGVLYVNPDGHEWKRGKWGKWVKRYWKLSERLMVKHANLLVCDSKNIETYINEEYKKYNPNTTFIAYGSDVARSTLSDDDQIVKNWYKEKNVKPKEYYLVVCRFVPENNYETMIREFMKSKTKKDLVIITSNNVIKFKQQLIDATHYETDQRIKFVGTVYEQQLLKKLRENAYAYLHGHEVGGTNPSLLEALASTKINLLLNVGFNKEVGEKGALYWSKEPGSLCALIDRVEKLPLKRVNQLSCLAKKRIVDYYSWDYIVEKYEGLFQIENQQEYVTHHVLVEGHSYE